MQNLKQILFIMTNLYVYLLEREFSDKTSLIILDSWVSVINYLSLHDVNFNVIRIHRMPICSKHDKK